MMDLGAGTLNDRSMTGKDSEIVDMMVWQASREMTQKLL